MLAKPTSLQCLSQVGVSYVSLRSILIDFLPLPAFGVEEFFETSGELSSVSSATDTVHVLVHCAWPHEPDRAATNCSEANRLRLQVIDLNNEVLLFGTGLHVTYIRPSHPSCHHSHHGDLPNHIPSIISLTGYHITHLSSIYRENCGCEQTPEMFHFQVHPHPLPHLHTW
eukprot:GHVN01062844.1.p1 GENE.GHVN01062844.1~~GHVN01062844.1.p1  ORF type:complete len:170 (+),score=10.50 GHVN01062844.1:174-683(+)